MGTLPAVWQWFSPVALRVSGPSQPRRRTSKPFGNPMSSRPLVVWWSRAMETIGPFRHWGSILGGPGLSPATWGHDGLFVAPKMFRCVFNPPNMWDTLYTWIHLSDKLDMNRLVDVSMGLGCQQVPGYPSCYICKIDINCRIPGKMLEGKAWFGDVSLAGI